MKKSILNLGKVLNKAEQKNLFGGRRAAELTNEGGGSYKCCWSGTSNCSSCVSGNGSETCVSGAELVAC